MGSIGCIQIFFLKIYCEVVSVMWEVLSTENHFFKKKKSSENHQCISKQAPVSVENMGVESRNPLRGTIFQG